MITALLDPQHNHCHGVETAKENITARIEKEKKASKTTKSLAILDSPRRVS
jgi:hypothetical protein